MMSEPLAKVFNIDPEAANVIELREAKEALRTAQATLAPIVRMVSSKIVALKGAARKKMQGLQDRAEGSQRILDKAQQAVDEAQSLAAATPILREAAEKAEGVEEVLHQMRET